MRNTHGTFRFRQFSQVQAKNSSLLEQIVGRLSLEPYVSGVSWEVAAENE
jgi:uncharacterized protein YqhQ